MAEEDTLKINAKYNGQKFSVELQGAVAEKMADIILMAVKGKIEKGEITNYA